MKLNVTYPLREVLDALNKSSDKLNEVVERMKEEGVHTTTMKCWEAFGMLSTSPYARVTFTSIQFGGGKVVGYMEETLSQNGPRTEVSAVRTRYNIEANSDYSQVTFA